VDRFDAEGIGLLALLRLVARAVDLPLVAAGGLGDIESFNLWAGQAHALAEARPAAEIVRALS
jgi:imidazole glycerol phosphate synthase subunit HisF